MSRIKQQFYSPNVVVVVGILEKSIDLRVEVGDYWLGVSVVENVN